MTNLQLSMPVTKLDNYHFETEVARQALLEHFGMATLDGFGCSGLPLAISAAGAIIHYIQETQKGTLGQLTRLSTYTTDAFMALDPRRRTIWSFSAAVPVRSKARCYRSST